MRTIIILLVLTSFIYSQTVYEIPFASKGNEIELTVENSSSITLQNVKVEAIDLPSWMKFKTEEETIKELKGNEEGTTLFKFSVEKEAPVKEETVLIFKVTNSRGESWNKEITVSVSAPNKFELNQNYPNPFNPTTTISYTIPANLQEIANVERLAKSFYKVTLKIYDILGREVETLFSEVQKPGYYKVEWNANNYASGMYVYQLMLNGNTSNQKVIRKKMLLLR